MLYHVQSGDVDTSVHASSHRHAAAKALKDCDKNLGACVMVNDGEDGKEMHEGSVFFLTQNILDDRPMKVVS